MDFTKLNNSLFTGSSRSKNSKGGIFQSKFILLIPVSIVVLLIIFIVIKSSQYSSAKTDQSTLDQSIQQLKISKDSLTNQLHEITLQRKNLQKDNENLLERERRINHELENTENEIKQMDSQYQQMAQDFDKAKTILGDLQDRNDDLNRNYKDISQLKDPKNSKIKEYQAQLKALQKQYDQLTGGNGNNNNKAFDSNIIGEIQFKQLNQWINPDKHLLFNLIYRGSKHSGDPDSFRAICADSNIANTLVIVSTTEDDIFGGFTFNNWEGNGFKADGYSFLFNFNNGKKYSVKNSKEAIFAKKGYGPIFGNGDIVISIKMTNGNSQFPASYGDGRKLELTNGKESFSIREVEIYKVSLRERNF